MLSRIAVRRHLFLASTSPRPVSLQTFEVLDTNKTTTSHCPTAQALFHSTSSSSYLRQSVQTQLNKLKTARTLSSFTTALEVKLEVTKLFESLCEIVGSDNVSKSQQTRLQYGKDESHFSAHPADFVVWPSSSEQVSQICKLCYDNDVHITPFGTGTGLEGGVNALKGGVCIALTKMNNVIEVNSEDFDCTVEAGVTWRDLNQFLNGTGLFFPVDPGASASLGGMISTNASGTNAVYYGTMKQNILNLEVVLPTGEIIKTSGIKTRSRKSSAGINLTELFVGAEGVFGIVTKATLRLYPVSETLCACTCHFDDNKTTIDTVIQLLQNSIPLSRIEFVDESSIKAANDYSKVDLPVKPSLFLEIAGAQSDIEPIVEITRDIIAENGGKNFKHSSINEERSKLWKARHELFYACRNTRPGHRTLITDVCVPISKLTDVVLEMQQYIKQYKLNGFSFGHVGDGNFHSVITYDENDKDEIERVFTVAQKIGDFAISLGGTCTGEHGVGRGKLNLVQNQFDDFSVEIMRRIKQTLDPKGLINAGKVIPKKV